MLRRILKLEILQSVSPAAIHLTCLCSNTTSIMATYQWNYHRGSRKNAHNSTRHDVHIRIVPIVFHFFRTAEHICSLWFTSCIIDVCLVCLVRSVTNLRISPPQGAERTVVPPLEGPEINIAQCNRWSLPVYGCENGRRLIRRCQPRNLLSSNVKLESAIEKSKAGGRRCHVPITSHFDYFTA